MVDVAARAGVSVSTVSHALNGTRYVAPALRERVERAMAELGYRHNALARSLRTGRSSMLALVIPDVSNPYYPEVARGVQDVADSKEYAVVLCNTDRQPDRELRFLRMAEERRFDGLIFDPSGHDPEVLTAALGREVILGAAERGAHAGGAPAVPPPEGATAEEYWPDMEGLDYRDTVTDFALPAGTFFDCAVVHVLTTATLDRLRALYPGGRFEVRRFRPNIVVEVAPGGHDFVENAWIGHTLAIGDAVRLSITGPCPRCVMTTLPQGDLPKDAGILRTAAQYNQVNVGVYAAVVQGGTVRRGDPVWLA